MPAAAVIPAPIAYIKVVAVKKLVVGFLIGDGGLPQGSTAIFGLSSRCSQVSLTGCLCNSGPLL